MMCSRDGHSSTAPSALLTHVRVLHDQQSGIGVVDDIANLLGGIGVVDGGEHAAARHDRRVGQVPVVGSSAHECHGIALLQAVMNQALGHGTHVSQELVGGDGHPIVAGLVGVQRLIAHTFGAVRIQVVDGRTFVQRRIAFGGGGEQAGGGSMSVTVRWPSCPNRRCEAKRYWSSTGTSALDR